MIPSPTQVSSLGAGRGRGMQVGKVSLVGAGPGDPGLLTVRGLTVLRQAEVIIYDRLVDPALLDEAPAEALRIFAGKLNGEHGLPQAEINALLIAHARQGRRVVRLKGGDPFIFGRGGEEAEALAAAGILFEVVPGISSAIAVPAYAGIPLTHRKLSSSFAVITGHEDACKDAPAVDWARLATAVDTLVVLMGVKTLPRIVNALLTHGRSPETPVALIRLVPLVERPLYKLVLRETGGIQLKAAKLLGINRNTLRKYLRRLHIRPPRLPHSRPAESHPAG